MALGLALVLVKRVAWVIGMGVFLDKKVLLRPLKAAEVLAVDRLRLRDWHCGVGLGRLGQGGHAGQLVVGGGLSGKRVLGFLECHLSAASKIHSRK
jgi:hypothetical protein